MTKIEEFAITIQPSWRGGGIGHGKRMLLEIKTPDKEKILLEFFLTLKDIDDVSSNKELFELKTKIKESFETEIFNLICEAKELFWKSLNDKYGA